MTLNVGDLGICELHSDEMLFLSTCHPTQKDPATAEFMERTFNKPVVATVLDDNPYKPVWFALSDHKRTGYEGKSFFKVLLISGYSTIICFMSEESLRAFTWKSLTDKG